jgi:hypothetical protein
MRRDVMGQNKQHASSGRRQTADVKRHASNGMRQNGMRQNGMRQNGMRQNGMRQYIARQNVMPSSAPHRRCR